MKRTVVAIGLISLLSAGVFAVSPLLVSASGNRITQPGQNIGFDLTNPGQEAAITYVFNLQGVEVAELTAQSLQHFSWDGQDIDRQPVESGMYVVQIRHHGQVWHGPVFVNH